jgi:hypothetical protein
MQLTIKRFTCLTEVFAQSKTSNENKPLATNTTGGGKKGRNSFGSTRTMVSTKADNNIN